MAAKGWFCQRRDGWRPEKVEICICLYITCAELFLFLHHVHTEPQGVQDGVVWEGELHGTPVGDKRWLPLSAGHGLGQQWDWIYASSERLVGLNLFTGLLHVTAGINQQHLNLRSNKIYNKYRSAINEHVAMHLRIFAHFVLLFQESEKL